MASPRQLHIGLFLRGPGHHVAAWRHPDTPPTPGVNLRHYTDAARTAERGLFDMVFLSDGLAARNSDLSLDTFERTGHVAHFEPLTLISALATLTERIGLVATSSTTYNEPFNVARAFASLDFLSGGRAGWNVVTSTGTAAANFGRDAHADHAIRYDRAREFVAVVKALWDGWDDGAFVEDKESGIAIDRDRIHAPHHRGPHFQVRGPLNIPRPPQGHPVIVQAGSSEAGQDLAADSAEVVFTAQRELADGQAFYRSLKGRMARRGRDPDTLKILPGLSTVVAASRAEAQEKYEQLQALIDPAVGLSLLSKITGDLNLADFPLDGPIPPLPDTNNSKSRQQLMVELARRENLTIRQLYLRVAGARGHPVVVGTASDVADVMEAWLHQEAADGFNLMPPVQAGGVAEFVDHVVPELQRRGLFRTAYAGNTLREHLGLARPAWQRHLQPSPADTAQAA